MTSLTELATKILAISKQLEPYRNSESADSATDSAKWLQTLPDDVDQGRLGLLDTLHELKTQIEGPVTALSDLIRKHTDVASLHSLYGLRLPQHVPASGSVSYATVAQKCAVEERVLRRLFRYAMTNGMFTEPEPGFVAHTSLSRLLLEDPGAFDALGMTIEDLAPASLQLLKALQKYPASSEPNETGFNIANNTNLPIYEYIAQDPERARRFGAGMMYFSHGDEFDLRHLITAFPWDQHDREEVLLVDVGGGHGTVATKIASATSKMRFIVQDMEKTVAMGKSLLPQELSSRIEFMAHDFLQEQTVKHADFYFFRWIMHNWSDKYCVKILQGLVPALKDGAKVLAFESVLGPPDTKPSNRAGSYLDMVMLCAFNGATRTEEGWKQLFAESHPNFVFDGVTKIPGSALKLIQSTWVEPKNSTV
ncbi:putative O-methyltransferase [Massariosphaeria phaeospora]|uniref:Putative O-methyltransferase n=1 Tax=Massariosphaeria phaeospora TaxID=100035 RepID=A0A7C8IJH1_9PLEO|nr:putative O-methyltransferase [Massariosphaeria phaeospora]